MAVYKIMMESPHLKEVFQKAYQTTPFLAGDAAFLENWSYNAYCIAKAGHFFNENDSEAYREFIYCAQEMTAELVLSEPDKFIEEIKEISFKSESDVGMAINYLLIEPSYQRNGAHGPKYKAMIERLYGFPNVIEAIGKTSLLKSTIVSNETAEKALFILATGDDLYLVEDFIMNLIEYAPLVAERNFDWVAEHMTDETLVKALLRIPVSENHPRVQTLLKSADEELGIVKVLLGTGTTRLHSSNQWVKRAVLELARSS